MHGEGGVRTCLNHPDKPATHQLAASDTPVPMPYCEKCSIMLASQGFSIGKIPRTTTPKGKHQRVASRSDRQKEVEGFLGELRSQVDAVRAVGWQVG